MGMLIWMKRMVVVLVWGNEGRRVVDAGSGWRLRLRFLACGTMMRFLFFCLLCCLKLCLRTAG